VLRVVDTLRVKEEEKWGREDEEERGGTTVDMVRYSSSESSNERLSIIFVRDEIEVLNIENMASKPS
jgi:hypothetical protein